MKIQHILLIGCTALSLSACQTFNGLKQDLSAIGNGISKTANNVGNSVEKKVDTLKADENIDNSATAIINDGACPPLSVDPQLSSMSEFYDMENPTKGSEVSTIELTQTTSSCKIEGEYLEVKIQLSFAGELGPKAKRKSGDRPFFAYPYFVAVTDNENMELAKELFAASVTYEKNQEDIGLVETIRQKLPLNEDGSTPPYQIKIGFQLTEEQLFYNASR